MVTSGGPDIVNDGLVLHLDAADRKSYPGSGSTWYDLSGQDNHVSLVNGPVFSDEKHGVFYFDGSNDYGTFASSVPVGNSNLASTIEITSYRVRTNIFEVMFGGGLPAASGNTSNHVYFGFRAYDSRMMFAYYGNDLDAATTNYKTNVSWNHYVATQSNSDGGGTTGDRQAFFNGKRVGNQTYRTVSRNTYYALGGFLQDGSVSYNFRGNIQSLKIYNRVLSADEILQNYNATKGRYGL